MANGITHSFVGGLTGLGVVLCDKGEDSETIHDPMLAIGAGLFFGRLPDILEPALNPHHRQFFHSIAVLIALGYGAKKVYEWRAKDRAKVFLRTVLLCAGMGYISHLLLDAATPRSIPLLGKI